MLVFQAVVQQFINFHSYAKDPSVALCGSTLGDSLAAEHDLQLVHETVQERQKWWTEEMTLRISYKDVMFPQC